MSDLVNIGSSKAPAAPAPVAGPSLPHVVLLPTRYYGRLALEQTARDFGEIARVDTRILDGELELTFLHIDAEAGPDVVDEFLNFVLYRSATTGEEGVR